jgi:hypothetical protein
MLLGYRSILRDKIKGTPLNEIHEETTEDFQAWTKADIPGLTVSEMIKLFLSHAGIDIQKSSLSHIDLMNIFNNLLSEKSRAASSDNSALPINKTA